MSDKPQADVSALTRGILQVSLKKVATELIDFKYIFLLSENIVLQKQCPLPHLPSRTAMWDLLLTCPM